MSIIEVLVPLYILFMIIIMIIVIMRLIKMSKTLNNMYKLNLEDNKRREETDKLIRELIEEVKEVQKFQEKIVE